MPEERNKSDRGTRFSAKNPLKIILLFEGTNNEHLKNPSAISELMFKYDLRDGVRVKNGARIVNEYEQGQIVNLLSGSGTISDPQSPSRKPRSCFLGSWFGCDSWTKVFEQYKWLRGVIEKKS